MTSDIADGRPPADDSRPVTFDEAGHANAFELAARWAGRPSWSFRDRAASEELAELACMPAVASWLIRWQPIHIHRAVLAGAGPEAVAAAFGGTVPRGVRALAGVGGSAASLQHLRPPWRHGRGRHESGGRIRRRGRHYCGGAVP